MRDGLHQADTPALPSLVDGSAVLRERKDRAARPSRGKTSWSLAVLSICFLLALGIHWGSLFGHFLSDDFAFAWGVSVAAQHDALWGYVWDHVVIREAQPGNFYRPLGFFTFALNWWLGGTEPFGWRFFNLLLHLGNGVLLYRLARQLAAQAPNARFAAVLAMSLWWLYPLTPEVTAWVCARFDALAVCGLLVCVERHAASRRALDGAQCLSLAALLFALGSKESAMTAPAFLVVVDLCGPAAAGTLWLSRLRRALLRLLPVLALFAAYLGWRQFLFGGSAVEVYAHSSPLEHLAPLDLWRRLLGMAPILRESFGALLWPLSLAVAATLATGAWCALRARAFIALWLLPALSCAIAVGAVLPHFFGAPPNGEGARLFYLAGVWLSLWLALPLATMTLPALPARVAGGVALAALIVCFAAAQAQAMVPWRKAAQAMRGLMPAVAAQAPVLRAASAHALVLLPDHWRTAIFARNAQLAPLVPPFQTEDLRDVLDVLIPPGIPEWVQRVREARTPWPEANAATLQYYCFDADAARLIPLSLPVESIATAASWKAAWEQAIAATACADEYARID